MDRSQFRDDLLTAVALAEFSYRHQTEDPELSRRSWQLAVDRLSGYPIDPYESLEALREVTEREAIETVEIIEITDPEER